jgi:hypothetical protein
MAFTEIEPKPGIPKNDSKSREPAKSPGMESET